VLDVIAGVLVVRVDDAQGSAQRQHGAERHRDDEDERSPLQERVHYDPSCWRTFAFAASGAARRSTARVETIIESPSLNG
jgi:hypothetical protein